LAKETLGAPGIRGGLVAAPMDMHTPSGTKINSIDLMSNQQTAEITSVSILIQKLVVFAIQMKLSGESKKWTDRMVQEYRTNTAVVVDALKELGLHPLVIPGGAFYVMVDASSLIGREIPDQIGDISGLRAKIGSKILKDDVDISSFFLYAAGVAVVPGSGFNAKKCSFRISCGKPRDELLEALERIQTVIQALPRSSLRARL
jgi:aspartate/methionine/tyrosine aminotransferase